MDTRRVKGLIELFGCLYYTPVEGGAKWMAWLVHEIGQTFKRR
jgi:hypothetical protein